MAPKKHDDAPLPTPEDYACTTTSAPPSSALSCGVTPLTVEPVTYSTTTAWSTLDSERSPDTRGAILNDPDGLLGTSTDASVDDTTRTGTGGAGPIWYVTSLPSVIASKCSPTTCATSPPSLLT